jgi:hypothetical protein
MQKAHQAEAGTPKSLGENRLNRRQVLYNHNAPRWILSGEWHRTTVRGGMCTAEKARAVRRTVDGIENRARSS